MSFDHLQTLLLYFRRLLAILILSLSPQSFSLATPTSPQYFHATPSAELLYHWPSATPNPTYLPTRTPRPPSTPRASTPPSTPVYNYQLQPDPDGVEGFYIMKNAPGEPMATVAELNTTVNQYRSSHTLNTLYIDSQICVLADQRAHEIESDFSHDVFSTHFENGDYNHLGFQIIGENIWSGEFSAVHIVEFGWDQSPGHRANLQGNWSRGCAGIYGPNVAFIFAR